MITEIRVENAVYYQCYFLMLAFDLEHGSATFMPLVNQAAGQVRCSKLRILATNSPDRARALRMIISEEYHRRFCPFVFFYIYTQAINDSGDS